MRLATILAALGAAPARAQSTPPATANAPAAQAATDTGARDVAHYARAAQAAYRAGDTAAFLRESRRTRDLAPTHPSALYQLARANALAGQPDSALALLTRLAEMGNVRDVMQDSALAPLRTIPHLSPALDRLAAAFAANTRPVLRSRRAFTVPDPDLLPEALAYDPVSRSFFIGSMAHHKVVRVWPASRPELAARVADFAEPAPDIARVLGLKVDGPRGRLWFAAWAQAGDTTTPLAATAQVDRSRLFAYDLRTGARLKGYAPPDTVHNHVFNDLVVTPEGDVYVTDSGDHAVYRIRADVDTLELFVRPGPARFTAPNGIALSGDGRRLYVAFLQDIATVDLATREVTYLDLPPDVTTAGVDGLAWYRGDLIAVQAIPSLERVVRFDLDASGRRVTSVEVLERAHPAWRQPTTGALVGDTFYYIPASNGDRLADDGALAPATGSTATPFFRIELAKRQSAD